MLSFLCPAHASGMRSKSSGTAANNGTNGHSQCRTPTRTRSTHKLHKRHHRGRLAAALSCYLDLRWTDASGRRHGGSVGRGAMAIAIVTLVARLDAS